MNQPPQFIEVMLVKQDKQVLINTSDILRIEEGREPRVSYGNAIIVTNSERIVTAHPYKEIVSKVFNRGDNQ